MSATAPGCLPKSRVVGSIPTAPTKSPMFSRVSSLVIPESTNRYYLTKKVLIQSRTAFYWNIQKYTLIRNRRLKPYAAIASCLPTIEELSRAAFLA